MLESPKIIPTPRICPKHIAPINVEMLIGNKGILMPTIGFLIVKVSNSAKNEQLLIIIPIVGFQTCVMGTFASVDNNDKFNCLSPKRKNLLSAVKIQKLNCKILCDLFNSLNPMF
jgi:hypothetical protein